MFYFGNGIDRRTLSIILIVVAVVFLLTQGTSLLIQILLTLPAVVIAMSFHEFAHAWVADKLGDYTPRSQGRLTLNPLAHIDPMGLILLFFVHIGWGKPVQINPNNFTSNKSRLTCEMLVSLAGPVMNFILAIAFTVLYYFMGNFAPVNNITEILMYLIMYTIILNIGLGVFNLIPLPPLDGEKIFRRFLPYSAIEWLDRNSNILQMIFFALWILGLLGDIVSPIINGIYTLLLNRNRSNFWSVFMKDILILGIESSCDETSVAVVKNGREVLSNIINSQIKIHEEYGGVVPEIASRCHIEVINQITKQAIKEAGVTLNDIDGIAVTCGPGLVGALLVGVSYAKSLSFALNKPLIAVNHIAGHIAGNFITHKDLKPPFLCLIISGGHTHLVNVKSYTEYEILGKTRDDAIGESFDKVARVIGLGYPGGPKIDEKAKKRYPMYRVTYDKIRWLRF